MSASFTRAFDGLDIADVSAVLRQLDTQADALMREDGVASDSVDTRHAADVCFIGQSYHLEVPFDLKGPAPLETLRQDFHKLHDRIYGYSADSPARIVNLRSVLQAGGGTTPVEGTCEEGGGLSMATRRVLFESGASDAAIYKRDALPPGFSFEGPAIVEQADATTLVPPGWSAENGAGGTLVLTSASTESAP
jgi:N-methylhydantoinase A